MVAFLGIMSLAALLVCLAAAAYFDLHTWRIPNRLLAAGALLRCCLLAALFAFGGMDRGVLMDAAAGCILGGGLFLTARLCRKGALGAGDVKLSALIGLYTGPGKVLWAGLISMLAAAAFVLAGGVGSSGGRLGFMKERLPLAPFFFFGTAVSLILPFA